MAVLMAGLALPAWAGILHVDASAGGAGSGATWADAYTDLTVALAAANPGDEVWVAAGTYHPGAPGQRTATFQLVSGVAVYGGFDGTETHRAQRDVAANPVILSGDLDDDDTYGAGPNWWQFNWTGSSNNSYHVVTGSGADATALLDGVTIRSGVGSDPGLLAGGGLLVLGGAPTLRDVTFQYNAVGFGSSAYLSDCTSTFEGCVVKDAYTCNCGSGGWTSGILVSGASDVAFIDCDFLNHYYVSSGNQGRGAALTIDFGATAMIVGCRFIGNQTGNFYPIGGGTAFGAGCNALGNVVIDRCQFLDNFAHAGAGLTIWNSAVVTNSLFARNEVVSHPENSAVDVGDYGGGLLTVSGAGDSVEITNCTFVDNNGTKGAGLALYASNTATLRNLIVYDNFADPPFPGEEPIWILKQNLVGDFDIAHSLVEGLLQTEPGEDPPNPANFPGCLDTPPLLVDLPGGDYRLSSSSPCIDAGDGAALPAGLLLDVAGAPRLLDDPATTDTGPGAPPVIDMGAHEFGGTADPWTDLGFALAGTHGPPLLSASGPLVAGTDLALDLTDALESTGAYLVIGFDRVDLPFYGGTLVPAFEAPSGLFLVLVTDPAGELHVSGPWPSGVPGGTELFLQTWVVDPAAPFGLAASNAVTATSP